MFEIFIYNIYAVEKHILDNKIKSPTRKLIILEAVSMGVRLRKHLEISSLQLFGQTVILPSGKML